MHMLRALSLYLLIGLMTLTGVGAASARGQMAADGVICGTGDFEVILAADGLPLFDGGGAPIEAQSLPCLDCVFGAVALVSPHEHDPPYAAPVAMTHRDTATTFSTLLWRMGGLGRSPPTVV